MMRPCFDVDIHPTHDSGTQKRPLQPKVQLLAAHWLLKSRDFQCSLPTRQSIIPAAVNPRWLAWVIAFDVAAGTP